ncbi:hypothetical protein O0L34_g6763 [Tuta absoluta]|nr:hypothetical protein O0L34_g6763 [Tuta absoluta]
MVGSGCTSLKPKYKGIENFLRKIAFNLGNTPSQTEVKIISCIPIDVTDLQKKICELERELEERDGGGGGRGGDNVEQVAQVQRSSHSLARTNLTIGAVTLDADSTPFACPSPDAADNAKQSSSHSLNVEPPSPSRGSLAVIDRGPTLIKPRSSTTVSITEKQNCMPNSVNEPNNSKRKRKVMPKFRLMVKKSKGKTQMMCYTHPKKKMEETTRRSRLRSSREEKTDHAYLENVMKQQYRPKPLNVEPSTSGEFSWPVCRDEPASSSTPPHRDSEVCSCCHGLFHNIPYEADTAIDNSHEHSAYYDSSLYDVIPVRETPIKTMIKKDIYQHMKNEVSQNRRLDDVYLEMERNFRHDNLNLPRVHYEQQLTTEYCTVNTPIRSNPKHRSKNKTTNKSALKKEQVIKAMQKRRHDLNLRMAEMSCSDYVECGTVYNKTKNPKPLLTSSTPRQPPSQSLNPPVFSSPRQILKNAECLTISFNNQETQSSLSHTVQMEPPPVEPSPPPPEPEEPSAPDNKTEITLNQIKSILHAVLTEVKTNTQKQVIEGKPKKDAVVQNGPSQDILAAYSSFMNSYQYSPKCSFCPYGQGRPCPLQPGDKSQRLYPPGTGVPPMCILRHDSKSTQNGFHPTTGPSPCGEINKCVQNYPIFIHTNGRQCKCCYRSVPTKPNLPSSSPQPADVPANRNEPRNQETNNLIKEIYKSLAINTNYTQNHNSSNYSSVAASNKKFEFKFEPKAKPKIGASEILHEGEQPTFAGKEFKSQFRATGARYRSEVQTVTTVSSAATESATPRGDGVRSLMSAKKELHSTSSDNANVHKRSPPAACKYSSPAENRDGRYGDNNDHEYSSFERRDQSYSPSKRQDQGPPSVHHMRRYSPPKTRDQRYSPVDKRSRRHSPRSRERGRSSITDEDTASSDGSEESVTTVIGREEKKKKGLFSNLKKLFTGRRRRRKQDSSSEIDQEATSDSDDYETVYSEVTNRNGKNTKHHRNPSPAPVPEPRRQRQRPHSKISFSRHHRPGVSATTNARRRHDDNVIPPRTRRSPYMEQEYRRHWAEDVGFHQGDTPYYSSRSPRARSRARREFDFAKYITPPDRPYNPYTREYEARPVLTSIPHSPIPARRPRTVRSPHSLQRALQSPYNPPRTAQRTHTQPRALQQPFYPRMSVQQRFNQYRTPETVPPYKQYRAPAPVPPYKQYRAPAPVPPYPPRCNALLVSKCGQIEQTPKPFIIPQELKHLYIPQSYKPATKEGVSWLKKLNKCTNINCGVKWKEFFLNG